MLDRSSKLLDRTSINIFIHLSTLVAGWFHVVDFALTCPLRSGLLHSPLLKMNSSPNSQVTPNFLPPPFVGYFNSSSSSSFFDSTSIIDNLLPLFFFFFDSPWYHHFFTASASSICSLTFCRWCRYLPSLSSSSFVIRLLLFDTPPCRSKLRYHLTWCHHLIPPFDSKIFYHHLI